MTTPTPTPTRTVRFRVARSHLGETDTRFDRFEVPVGKRTTILDALVAIRNKLDSTLTLRHSCFHASCGTCGMRVNGREGLACVTPVEGLGDEVTVEPLANHPVVSDLVVEMDDFVERFDLAERPLVRRSEAVPGAVPPEGIEAYTRYEDCIECGICLSACPVVAVDERYLGPAALAAAWRVVEEPRGADRRGALAVADDPHGIWRCHTAWECSEACPSNVDPAGAIMRLRRRAIADRVASVFGGRREER